jgi:SAM-dependent methyltransferase
MLARFRIEPWFADWNRHWGAPFGLEGRPLDPAVYDGVIDARACAEISRLGLFSAQPNNSTRLFEYPWAYFISGLQPAMNILEVGGALSGFQFVLSREGHRVHNVDPGVEHFGFRITPSSMDTLNRVFHTDVNLMNCPIEGAALPQGHYDRVFSLSVLEHLSPETIDAAMDRIHYALRPGGLLVLTVDLFLDLAPFTRQTTNKWGRNVPIPVLSDPSRFELVHGRRSELFGFDEFDPQQIVDNAHRYFIGRNYPTLIQTLVLRRLPTRTSDSGDITSGLLA